MIADAGRAIWIAAGGVLVFAPAELLLALATYTQDTPWLSLPNLLALVATLGAILWLVLALGTAALLIGARLAISAAVRRPWLAPGLLVAGPLQGPFRPNVPRAWAAIATALVIEAVVQRGGMWALTHYKQQDLIAAVIGGFAIAAAALALVAWRVFVAAARAGGEALHPVLRFANPLARWSPACVAFAALTGGVLIATWQLIPESRSTIDPRLVVAGVLVALGMGAGALAHARFAGWRTKRRRTRRGGLVFAGASCVLITATLVHCGADPDARYVPFNASPALEKIIDVVKEASDVDGDGVGSLLGDNDCDPFDSDIYPGAIEIPNDGIDQDCNGKDLTYEELVLQPGEKATVPEAFKRDDWNVLFITIDTVRYDRTTFGGYKESPAHRDTTPRLAELVKQSTSFTFCNAPSAGTMASIPAIITSKYFHSGIALDENVPKGAPPRLMKENTTLPELMHDAGYKTGVIASHEYWNDWGMDQGVDDYDNSIGKTPDPYRVAADKVTNHAVAWIEKNRNQKWFLWAHYIDPHGRYVAHPDVVDWGDSESDKYDSELKWTDQEIGRLLDTLRKEPGWDKTIIVVTSDHGDSMAEHNVPLGTHGTALYRELQHVPMIIYVPNNKPHLIGGAVSNLDLLPTILDLTGVSAHGLDFEGRSEVGAIFYGKEDHERIVFAETNLPDRQRAAISEHYKLIDYISKGVFEFFDLKADPWEKVNLAPKKPPEMAPMKQALDTWLERVMYLRDPRFNQQIRQMHDVLLGGKPAPEVPVTGRDVDDKIETLGLAVEDGKRLAPENKVDVHVYFHAKERTDKTYKFGILAWPVTGDDPQVPADVTLPASPLRTSPHLTGDGAFTTNRWHEGEYVRERFVVNVPKSWATSGATHVAVVLVVVDTSPGGKTRNIGLGTLPLSGGTAGSGSGSSAPKSP